MAAILDFGAFDSAELTSMLTAAKAEYLGRLTTGRVKQGGSAAQQYAMDILTVDQLIELINGLSAALGFQNVETRAAPNFNTCRQGSLDNTFGA